MSEFANNESAFEALLESIKQASNNIKRDAGTRFETLIKDWLTQDQSYCDLFSKVETFEEWASSHPELEQSGKDIGIDLVATLEDDPDAFAAIQCKFYDKDAVVPKSGVDSFIAASNRDYFKQRYIITTNENWSENALTEMQNVTPPIQLVRRSMLASSRINWSVYLNTGKVVQQKKRTPRKYQEEAIQRVIEGFKTNNRGKLIMACGTGKTFTSMKIAEKMEGNNGFVMFLVPSLALLSQTLTDWKRQCAVPIHAFAVCSDATTGKADLKNVDEITSASDLSYPATTKADRLAEEVKKARSKTGMTVIFSTYQSIEVVSEAQHKFGMEEIGLIICDEAHRTAGGHYQDESDAPFQRIHSDDFIKGKKRLYMTATPRIYGDLVKEQKNNGEVVLYSMDDEQIYGPTFHTITFSQAVALGSLVDYKVIVLSVEENILKERALSDYELVQAGGLPVKHAAKVIGCWRALSKLDLVNEVSMSDDRQPMRRAVGFAQIIEPNIKYLDRTSSKRFTENFESTIEEFKDQQFEELSKIDKNLSREAYDLAYPLKCETRHIDGSMNATEKDALLNWLREEPEENVCKILFNVRCLSEGVDVPSLDAVLFLSPRKSQVEVVQTVGRVMRVSPQTGKKRGYVIIPIVTPAGLDPSVALNNNADFDVVWQVLNALKSIDTEFGAIVDGQRNIIDSSEIEVVCVTNKKLNKKAKKNPKIIKSKPTKPTPPVQEVFDFNHDEILEQEIRARIVKRVGNRREWGDWAEDVGKICQLQIKHINDVLKDPTKTKSREAFESFKKELKATLNDSLTDDEIVEMLGQHVVTQPILDALFTIQTSEGTSYEFSKQNPIAIAMTSMMDSLDKESMKLATKSLEDFYRSVRNRTRTIKTSSDRQLLIKELFEKFFKAAFPKQQEKLGIVYTPIEIVDFINQSVADLLKKEFNCSIADDGIHILDPFSGTGTFIARLMQSGLIPTDRLPNKFEHELHANEIVPLAYYVASMNIEGVFHELCPNEVYQPNKVMIWTDTFANNKQSNIFSTELGENNARLAMLNRQDIRVIVGNPPYSVGQESANDDNQNDHYEELDARLAATYVQETVSSNKNGALATNRMEALAADSSALAETQRMGAQVQTTMLDHASSARKGYGTFWVDGIYSKTDSGDFTRFTRSTGAYGYEADTTGFAFGADLPMGDDTWRLGAAFSAQRGDLDGSYGLSSDIEGYGFSVYGGKTFSTCLNVSGALTYMTANHEVDAYNLGKVKADIDADMWVLGARMSMPFGQNRVWMTPYLGVDVMKLTQDGFTSSWSGMDAFRYSDVDATIVRTPVGVRAGTFMPLELFGRSGTVNWDADISFIPQFGDKDADFKVSGISNGHSDGMSAEFVNDWLSQAKFGMNYQGAAGAFGLYYAVEKGDVRNWSSSVNAKASLFF